MMYLFYVIKFLTQSTLEVGGSVSQIPIALLRVLTMVQIKLLKNGLGSATVRGQVK